MLLNEYTNYVYPCCLDCVELECSLDSLPIIALASLKHVLVKEAKRLYFCFQNVMEMSSH